MGLGQNSNNKYNYIEYKLNKLYMKSICLNFYTFIQTYIHTYIY